MEIIAVALAVVVVLLASLLLLTRKSLPEGPLSQAAKSDFQKVVQESLSETSESFLRLAEERYTRLSDSGNKELEGKKELIDQQLAAMKSELLKVSNLVQQFEKDREAKFGQLTSQIKFFGEQTATLNSNTASLREVLASSRARGQWGERMVDDVLRSVGFREHINYEKQKTIDGASTRPDFIFILPDGLKLNMDVKFPLDNYQSYIEVESEIEKGRHRSAFISDVKNRIREVTSREYIDPEQGTLDYVLLFIPMESIYAFIHEEDPSLIDFSMRNRVVMCSPLSLFALLSMIRQASDNFALQRNSEQVISLFGRFSEEWRKFTDSMDTLGKRLVSTNNAFQAMSTTRRRALESPLKQIDEVRQQRGIKSADSTEVLPGLFPVYREDSKSAFSREALSQEDEAEDPGP
jgi:DNA recombination protein RmuC